MNARSSVGCYVVILVSILLSGSINIGRARTDFVPDGTTWSPTGSLQLKGKGRRITSNLSVDVILRPIGLSYADVIDGTIRPMNRTETGEVSSHSFAWTGTQSNGEAAGGGIAAQNCNDWMPLGAGSGSVGELERNDSGWSEQTTLPCTESAALYCFEQ